jgi:hypothetical protein
VVDLLIQFIFDPATGKAIVHKVYSYEGEGVSDKAPFIHNLDTIWSGQLHAPTTLPPKKRPWYLWNIRLLVAKNQSGSLSKKGNPLPCQKSAFTP